MGSAGGPMADRLRAEAAARHQEPTEELWAMLWVAHVEFYKHMVGLLPNELRVEFGLIGDEWRAQMYRKQPLQPLDLLFRV